MSQTTTAAREVVVGEVISSAQGRKVAQNDSNKLPRVNGTIVFLLYIALWFVGLRKAIDRMTEGRTGKGAGVVWPPLPFDIEQRVLQSWSLEDAVQFFQDSYWIPTIATMLYALLITFGPIVMKNRSRWRYLKHTMVVWNFIAFTFSLIGAYRVIAASYVATVIQDMSVEAYFCGDDVVAADWNLTIVLSSLRKRCESWQGCCLWVNFFVLSKIPEMTDTLFLVLAKKNVRFIHWYHHITVMWFCWVSVSYATAAGPFFALMNLTVHSLMYFWYFLAAADKLLARGLKPGKTISAFLTILQILQFIFGVTVTFYIASFPKGTCLNHPNAITFSVVIYISYLMLFVWFFYKAYCVESVKMKEQ